MHRFQNFLAVLPPPTLYKFETQKEFWLHISKMWGEVRGWAWLYELENAKEMQECPKTFVHDCWPASFYNWCSNIPRELLYHATIAHIYTYKSPVFWNLLCKWHVMCNAFCHILALQRLPKKICCSTAAIIIRSTELNLGCFLALETIVD